MQTGAKIFHDCKLVAKSRNFRGILDYARKYPVKRIRVTRLLSESPNGERFYPVTFTFQNGAIGEIDFADWRVLARVILSRRSWDFPSIRCSGLPEFVYHMAAMTGGAA